MASPTETYVDPADGAAAGNDHGGAAFVDGSFANATNTLTKVGAFPAATCQAGDKLYLDDNGSSEVTAALYTISARTDDDNVVMTADIRSGAPDPTDVRCDQHTGAVGLPWATVQHALDFTTRDAVDGDRFNVKAGTDDVLAAALDFTAYGTPSAAAPWICQGYTAAAEDGGIGGISGAGNFSIISSTTLDWISFVDLHLHNCGSATIVRLDDNISIVNCELDNTAGTCIYIDHYGRVINCHLHNIGSFGVRTMIATLIAYCTFENGVNDFSRVVEFDNGTGQVAIFNVLKLDGSSIGIYPNNDSCLIAFNSIYCSAGTGKGINTTATAQLTTIVGNIVEGFSGVGGVGIDIDGDMILYGHNAFYNNTTNLSSSVDFILDDLTANDIDPLAASAFIDAANDDFRVKPSVQALGYLIADYPNLAVRSYLDIGALQRKSQMLTHPGMAGGAKG